MRTLRLILTLVLVCALSASASANSSATELSSLPAAAQANVSAALGRNSAEFYAHPANGGFEAASGGLATRFASTGVDVSSGGARWGLRLSGYGYGDALRSAAAVSPQATKNRVEYRHGALTEWYVNGPMGLEQGFTINKRPGKANGQPLTIALETSGDLTSVSENNETSVTLKTASGQETFRYSRLTAYDADGKGLQASLRVQGMQLLLQVDDRNARYPVVVDPVVQLAKLSASDSFSGEGLGVSVSMSGDVIVVGTYVGGAYVFVKPRSGWKNMTETAKLRPSDFAPLGESVAINGDVIVVGAPQANQWQGSAYVFLKPPGGWKDMTETAKLMASDGAPGDFFGAAVAISGATVVLGAPMATVNNNFFQGAAYVFLKPMGALGAAATPILTETAKLAPSDPTGGDDFGRSIAISGKTVAIGAPGGDGGRGEGYVFLKPHTGWVNMTETAQLKASVGGGDLGRSIATNESTVAVGATDSAAFVFVEPQSGWADMTETAQLLPTKCCWSFGHSVAINPTGQAIVVGAPEGNGHRNGTGDAFVFLKPPTGWQTTTQYQYRLFSSDAVVRERFGVSVSLAGKSLVAGAPAADNLGAAYVFATK